MTSDDPFIQFLIDAGKQAIESRDEYIPTLTTEDANGHTSIFVLAGDAHPHQMLLMMAPKIRELRPARISFTVDSYTIGAETKTTTRIYAQYGGSLAAAFAAGEPEVRETLMINVVTPDEELIFTLPYLREPDGSITWDEMREPGKFSGRILDALRSMLR
jgi:hypothetical protein